MPRVRTDRGHCIKLALDAGNQDLSRTDSDPRFFPFAQGGYWQDWRQHAHIVALWMLCNDPHAPT